MENSNQPHLLEALETLSLEDFSSPHRTLDEGHARIEIQQMRTSTALNADVDWTHMGQIFRVERHVTDLLGGNLYMAN